MNLLQALKFPLPQRADPASEPPSRDTQAMPPPPGQVDSKGKEPGFGTKPRPLSPKDVKPRDDGSEWVPANLVKTPYGRVHRYVEKSAPNADAFNKFAFNAVEDEITARQDGASLDKTMSGEKTVSAFVAKHLKSFEAEVSTNRSGNVKSNAVDMEQQRQMIGGMSITFQHLQLTLGQAQGHLSSAIKRIESIKDLEAARRLEARARAYEKKINAANVLIGAVLGGGVALITGNAWAALKPMWDASVAVTQLTQDENSDAKAAKEKHREGTNKALAAANEDMDTAESVMAGAVTMATSMHGQLETAAKLFAEMQTEAEGNYDKQTRGAFKFSVLAQHAKWVADTRRLADGVVKRAQSAHFYADGLLELYRATLKGMTAQSDGFAEFAEGALTAKEIVKAADQFAAKASQHGRTLNGLDGTLLWMRVQADMAMVRAPDAGAPGKKKP